MKLLTLFITLAQALAFPLSPFSTITMRSTIPSSIFNSPIIYRPLILEEWSSTNQLLQSWYPTCTLAGIQTETYMEGLVRPRYPYLDGIWFLCRDVPANSSFSYSPAPVVIMNIGEDGNMYQYSADNNTYPVGTTTNQVLAYFNETLNANIFYLMGGGIPAGSTGIARALQPRIRVDYVPRVPPPPANVAGVLASLPTTTTPWGLAIMTDSLFMPANFLNGTVLTPVVYMVGAENSLPTVARATIAPSLFTTAPSILSFCSFPLSDILWYTFFNRVASLARADFSDPNPQTRVQSWSLPTTTTGGTLGGSSWRVLSVALSLDGTESIYISNGTMIMTNTLTGLTLGQPFMVVLISPPDWKYLDAYVRTQGQAPPNVPSPSPRPTATPTRTMSRTATQTASPSLTQTSTATMSQTATQTASSSLTSSPSVSATSSSSPSVTSSITSTQTATSTLTTSITPSTSTTPTSFRSPSFSPTSMESPSPTSSVTSSFTAMSSPSMTASATATASGSPSQDINPPMPIPASSATLSPAAGAGVGVAVVAVVGALGFFTLTKITRFRTFYISKFGMKAPGKGSRMKKPTLKTNVANFEISQNPYLASQARVAQLKQMQIRGDMELGSPRGTSGRFKKEFQPNMSKQAVRIIGLHGREMKEIKGMSV